MSLSKKKCQVQDDNVKQAMLQLQLKKLYLSPNLMIFTNLILPIAGWQRGGGVLAAAETWLWERRPGWGEAGVGGVALCGRPRLDPRHELLVKVALHGCSLFQRGGEARWEAVHHRQGALRVVHLGRGLEFSTFLSCWSSPKVSFSSTKSADPEPVMSPHLNSNTARFLRLASYSAFSSFAILTTIAICINPSSN